MEAIKHITAIQIIEQKGTNSVPFLVLCDDGELYIAKTVFKKQPPFEDLINEILCVYFLALMNVKTINPAIIKIPQDVFNSALQEGKQFDKRYNDLSFEEVFFFGSQQKLYTTEVEVYNTILKNKHDFNKYSNPLDFLKIGVFDYWIGNMDRRGDNPNILLNETEVGTFEFLPIDHTQAFAYQGNYKALRLELMSRLHPKSILKTPMSKSIVKFASQKLITNFHKEIQVDFGNVIDNIEFVFEQVPSQFGLSKKGREKITAILSDEDRNKKVSMIYLNN
ncbi:MAG: hypothetical protein L0J59_05330 [Lactococcus lactis]|nr:hypothetical protein [Lactococcus lactis]